MVIKNHIKIKKEHWIFQIISKVFHWIKPGKYQMMYSDVSILFHCSLHISFYFTSKHLHQSHYHHTSQNWMKIVSADVINWLKSNSHQTSIVFHLEWCKLVLHCNQLNCQVEWHRLSLMHFMDVLRFRKLFCQMDFE